MPQIIQRQRQQQTHQLNLLQQHQQEYKMSISLRRQHQQSGNRRFH